MSTLGVLHARQRAVARCPPHESAEVDNVGVYFAPSIFGGTFSAEKRPNDALFFATYPAQTMYMPAQTDYLRSLQSTTAHKSSRRPGVVACRPSSHPTALHTHPMLMYNKRATVHPCMHAKHLRRWRCPHFSLLTK